MTLHTLQQHCVHAGLHFVVRPCRLLSVRACTRCQPVRWIIAVLITRSSRESLVISFADCSPSRMPQRPRWRSCVKINPRQSINPQTTKHFADIPEPWTLLAGYTNVWWTVRHCGRWTIQQSCSFVEPCTVRTITITIHRLTTLGPITSDTVRTPYSCLNIQHNYPILIS